MIDRLCAVPGRGLPIRGLCSLITVLFTLTQSECSRVSDTVRQPHPPLFPKSAFLVHSVKKSGRVPWALGPGL
nr:MAG TPA: hypothetical protein [Inoviridae sp.]